MESHEIDLLFQFIQTNIHQSLNLSYKFKYSYIYYDRITKKLHLNISIIVLAETIGRANDTVFLFKFIFLFRKL